MLKSAIDIYTLSKNRNKTSYYFEKYESFNDILSKLKFISNIQEGDKINVKTMSIEPPCIFTSISRTFINPDNRLNTLNFIDSTIKRSLDVVDRLLPNDSGDNSTSEIILNILNSLENCVTGINNLKCAYKNDIMFICKLDTYIDLLCCEIKKYREKYNLSQECIEIKKN